MIRVGIIGAGFMGRNHFNQYEKMTDRCKVVALCDKEADRRAGDWSKVGGNIADAKGSKRDLAGIKPFTDYRDMLASGDVDLVDICVPTFAHRELVIGCLQANKHVLCEKPMALTLAECDEMLAAAAKSKGLFMMAQVIRFWPEYVYLKQVIDSREFGQVRSLQFRRQAAAPEYTLGNWALDPKLSGGALLDLHIHDVDYVLHLFGKPRSIFAQGYTNARGSVDRIHAAWDYGDGRIVQIEGFWDMPASFGFNMGFSASFEKAAIVWDMNTGKPLTVHRHGADPLVPQLSPEDGYHAEIAYFLGCIERNEAPQITTPQQSRDDVALALIEKESIQTGKVVAVE